MLSYILPCYGQEPHILGGAPQPREVVAMYQLEIENESHLISAPRRFDEEEAIEEAARRECIVAFY